MNRTTIQKKLFELQDKEYALFQSKLTPSVNPEVFIGVRVPGCRKLAKELFKNNFEEIEEFFCSLPHKYYDENMLHGLLISEIKDFNQCMAQLERFLPYVDNWAVCDIMSPKCFKKHKSELLLAIKKWVKSSEEYTIRFGLEMLMSHYLDEDFEPEYLKIAAQVKSDKYYVNMMVAWFFATALTKQWDSTISYIENGVLETWTNNKTIQKARESYRITPSQKEYLLKYKKQDRISYLNLRERPELKEVAAEWFHSKWGISTQSYLECMNAYLDGKTEHGWYLCLDGDRIVGGLGVVENDFHDRKDLTPNVCAVYTEINYRCRGIAGKLLNMVVEDTSSKGLAPIYLLTDLTGFYERYGWEFLCMVQGSRMYVHK